MKQEYLVAGQPGMALAVIFIEAGCGVGRNYNKQIVNPRSDL